MKQRILIINNHLRTGGAENSLVSLLNQIDYSKYDIDLFLFQNSGTFIERLPQEVNIIDAGIDKEYFLPLYKCIINLLLKGKIKTLYYKLYSNILTKIFKKNFDQINSEIMYKLVKYNFKSEYDVAVAYKHVFSNVLINKVRANKKIAYVHSDYISMKLNPEYDRAYLRKLDVIATVSAGCLSSLTNIFPEIENKTIIAPNIISPSLIRKMSEDPCILSDYDGIKILTVARLDFVKGIDLAIDACVKLKKENVDFKWYILGGGNVKKYKEMVKKHNLCDEFIFLGETNNPYPYIHQCDIYVQPSRTEGKSIAIEEAKVLYKPIVVTNYKTVNDQINSNYNGVIVPINGDSIANGIIKLLNSPKLQANLSNNLANEKIGNEEDVEIFYKIIS